MSNLRRSRTINDIGTIIGTISETVIDIISETVIGTISETVIDIISETVIGTISDTVIDTISETVIENRGF